MKKFIISAALVAILAACSGADATCEEVPTQFFRDISVQGTVMQAGAVKSAEQTLNGQNIYLVAARFDDGVAVWSTGRSIVGGGPTFPMNESARAHSETGVDAPTSAIPDDPDGVSAAQQCVQDQP